MPKPDSSTQRCYRCKSDLPLEAFALDRTRKGGRKNACRSCDGTRRRPSAGADDKLIADIKLGGEGLAAFGTPLERLSAEALIAAGSIVAAAESIAVEPRVLRAHLYELRRKSAARGYAPANDMTKTVPDGVSVKGVSTYYDGDGNIRGQWVKSKREEDQYYTALLDAMSHIADTWKAVADPVKRPVVVDKDLMAAYLVGDAHLGMYAWAQETGTDHDLKIAERDLCAGIDHLVDLAPRAEQGLLISVGDFFHADNRASTTTNGTPVDSDGRWPKVMGVGIRAMRHNIDRGLTKHDRMHVIIEIGNHDWHASMMLAMCLAQFYEREPRVTIDTSPSKFHKFVFGKNLIATTHGDTVKLAALGEIMACDWPEEWASCTGSRQWITGHIHHETVKELRGCTVRSLRTLAPADAWHRGQGYRSGRDITMLIYHREHGQINQHTVGIQQLLSK